MAKQMAYTDATGTSHPSSYWCIAAINIDRIAKKAEFVFAGYHSSTAREQPKAPIGQVTYRVEGAEYEAFEAQYRTSSNMKLEDVAYVVASTKRVPTGGVSYNDDGIEVPETKLFFLGATDLVD